MPLDDEETKELLVRAAPGGRIANSSTQSDVLPRVTAAWKELVANRQRYTIGRSTLRFAIMCFAALRGINELWDMHKDLRIKLDRNHVRGLLTAYAARSDMHGIAKVRAAMFTAKIPIGMREYVRIAKAASRASLPTSYLLSMIEIVKRQRLHLVRDPEGKESNFVRMYREAVNSCITTDDLRLVLIKAAEDGVPRAALSRAIVAVCRQCKEEHLAREAFELLKEDLDLVRLHYMGVLVACQKFDEPLQYLDKFTDENAVLSLIGVCMQHCHAARDPYHEFVKTVLDRAHKTCSHRVWLRVLKVHTKVRDIEAVEDHVVLYMQLYPNDHLRMARLHKMYAVACSTYLEGTDGPFSIEAATEEDFERWRQNPFPPHVHTEL